MIISRRRWEQFGFTVRLSSFPEGSTPERAIQLVIAQGDFPDVIKSWDFPILGDFAKEGKIAALDKYFNDPENYPQFAKADKSYLAKYMTEGKIYGLPGNGWVLGDATSHNNMWIMRLNIYEKYGYPETTDELLDVMRKVKREGFPDIEGKPAIPFGMFVFPYLQKEVLYSLKDAGWEVDLQKRLMPKWASIETYEAFQYLNVLWREGMFDPGQFLMDGGTFHRKLMTASYVFGAGGGWLGSLMYDTIEERIKEYGQDSPVVQAA